MFKVALSMPMRSASSPHLLAGLGLASATDGRHHVQLCFAAGSLLTFSFNQLWAGALSGRKTHGFTHFAMLHDDICPTAGWLDTLMDLQRGLDADIVAAVVPIKDARGLTSTALDTTGDEWRPRRLTMHEVYHQSETFTHPAILLNTGCWVCPLDRDWCDKVAFRQQDSIVAGGDGSYLARTIPEDWDFSRQVRAAGGTKLFATRAVRLDHERPEYTNTHPWGELTTDNFDVPEVEAVELTR